MDGLNGPPCEIDPWAKEMKCTPHGALRRRTRIELDHVPSSAYKYNSQLNILSREIRCADLSHRHQTVYGMSHRQ